MLTAEAVAELQKLAIHADRIRGAVAVQRQQVEQARARGASWSSIAAALGISRQAAQQRYGPRVHARVDEAVSLW